MLFSLKLDILKFHRMIKGFLYGVKVDKSVKPIHFKNRKAPKLEIGGDYFVSFGSNDTYPCILKEIETREGSWTSVTIEIPIKPMSKNGFIDVNKKISHHWVSTHSLFPDEIGLTREEAVINTVSS